MSIARSALLLSLTALTLAASVPSAQAIVCARGVYRAGCVGPNGAVVVARPVYHPVYPVHGCFWRAGIRVCR
ncbi:MAG TPA: hypothetical protein VGG11_02160 [Xanthobacteraceae bacterium]